MRSVLDSLRGSRAIFGLVCAAVLAFEGYVVFVDRDHTFGIEGGQAYDVAEFAGGKTVSHAFLMRGDGFQAVRLRFSSDAAVSVPVQWTLWRGSPDQPTAMTRAFEQAEFLDLKPGRQWKTLTFTRDGSSHDRWYTVQLRLLDLRPAPFPQVSVVASHDNPDRGGVLWVDGKRLPGSLVLRAERRGRALYRRFLLEAAPNLPGPLRIPVVQWCIAVAFHWALIVFVYAVVTDGYPRSVSPDTP